jgi:hypothetical protein
MKQDESRLQQACVKWFNLQHSNLNRLLLAIPNGARRDRISGARLKAEGMVAGAADLILLVPDSHGKILCIEMKTKIGRQTTEQKEFQAAVENTGNKYIVCRSVDQFIKEVNGHLKN